MAYAHQGIELRPLPGLAPPEHAPTVVDASFKGSDEPHPILLTRKGTEALVHVEHLLDDANHALTVQGAAPGSLGALDGDNGRASTLTAATDQRSPAISRGD
jgi:hypothetical protein